MTQKHIFVNFQIVTNFLWILREKFAEKHFFLYRNNKFFLPKSITFLLNEIDPRGLMIPKRQNFLTKRKRLKVDEKGEVVGALTGNLERLFCGVLNEKMLGMKEKMFWRGKIKIVWYKIWKCKERNWKCLKKNLNVR